MDDTGIYPVRSPCQQKYDALETWKEINKNMDAAIKFMIIALICQVIGLILLVARIFLLKR